MIKHKAGHLIGAQPSLTLTPPRGVEQAGASSDKSGELRNPTKTSGAESGANSTDLPRTDPDLAKVIEAWPALPEHLKAAIKALVQAHDG